MTDPEKSELTDAFVGLDRALIEDEIQEQLRSQHTERVVHFARP